jgi:hypothetical protein
MVQGVEFRVLALAGHMLYHLSHTPSPDRFHLETGSQKERVRYHNPFQRHTPSTFH